MLFLCCDDAYSSLMLTVSLQLFERDPTRRLGIVGNIRLHPFFKAVNWQALERREVEPPFKPKVVCLTHINQLGLDCDKISLHTSAIK